VADAWAGLPASSDWRFRQPELGTAENWLWTVTRGGPEIEAILISTQAAENNPRISGGLFAAITALTKVGGNAPRLYLRRRGDTNQPKRPQTRGPSMSSAFIQAAVIPASRRGLEAMLVIAAGAGLAT